jgi:hypothetical protein
VAESTLLPLVGVTEHKVRLESCETCATPNDDSLTSAQVYGAASYCVFASRQKTSSFNAVATSSFEATRTASASDDISINEQGPIKIFSARDYGHGFNSYIINGLMEKRRV